jgi:hypothetical protein
VDIPQAGRFVAAIVAVAAALVVVAVVVIHKSSEKRTITGCVNSGENGMSVTDDKDKRFYASPATRQASKIKPKDAGKTLVWETKNITKDFGVCQP